jgi:hypothetical protein
MCDLWFSSVSRVGEPREREYGIMGARAYKKDISRFFPMHIKLLNLFDL